MKSYSSGGLYEILIRIALDLVRKISIKILSVLMQKLGFQLYEIEFLTKRATAPFQHLSNLIRSSYFKFTAQNCIVKFSFA